MASAPAWTPDVNAGWGHQPAGYFSPVVMMMRATSVGFSSARKCPALASVIILAPGMLRQFAKVR